MVETRIGKDLKKKLFSVLGAGVMEDPHVLLRAYCSCLVAETKDPRIDVSNESLRGLLIPELLDGKYEDLRRQFLRYSATRFLRFVAPFEALSYEPSNEVGPVADYKLRKAYGFDDFVQMMLTILVLKQIGLARIIKSKKTKRDAYEDYKSLAKDAGIHKILGPEKFRYFVFWLYGFKIKDQTSISKDKGIFKAESLSIVSSINGVVDMLFNEVTLQTRERVGTMLQRIYSEFRNEIEDNEEIKIGIYKILKDLFPEIPQKLYENARFSRIGKTDELIYDMALDELSRSILTVNVKNAWFDVLCEFHVSQRREDEISREKSINSDALDRPNDVPLEVSILKSLASANMGEPATMLVILPSPYFIKRWIEESENGNKSCKTVFAVENAFCVDVLEEYFHNSQKNIGKPVRDVQKQAVFIDIHDNSWFTDYIYTDMIINEPLLCMSDEDVFKMVKEYVRSEMDDNGEERRVISLCADSWMLEPDKALFSSVRPNKINSILLFPEKIGGTAPLMKNIWIADNHSTAPEALCDVYQFTMQKQTKETNDKEADEPNNGRGVQLLCKTDYPTRIPLELYIESGRPIREFYKPYKKVDKPRSSVDYEYRFCNEVRFMYHRTPLGRKNDSGEDLYKYKVWFVSYNQKSKENNGELHRPSSSTQKDFSTWIEDKYINEVYSIKPNKRKKQNDKEVKRNSDYYNGKTIRQWIADTVGKQYKGAAITLRALWVFYPEIQIMAGLSDLELDILKEYIFISDIGHLRMDRISEEEISDFYDSGIEDKFHVAYGKVKTTFFKLFTFAIRQNHCNDNPFRSPLSSKSDEQKLRNALVKKILTSEEFKNLYSLLMCDVKRGDIFSLFLLTKMMTGMSTPEQKSLRWSDLITLSGYGAPFHGFQVYRRIVKDGTLTRNLPLPVNIRIIPLGRDLGEFLSLRGIGKKPDSLIFSEDGFQPIADSRIAKKMKHYLMKLGLYGEESNQISIILPDDNDGFSECILTKYQGDLLRENYKHWAIHAARFSLNETSAILGLERYTTLGRHYVDFNNEQTLFYMHVKQCRLEAFMETDETKILYESQSVPKRIGEKKNSMLPLQVEIQMKPECASSVDITVSNSFGLKVDRFNVRAGEGKI